MTLARTRVAAYVVRYGAAGPELLVSGHAGAAGAGTRVPAGGVRDGESAAEAVVREVREKTGLDGLRLARALAVDSAPHPDTGEPCRTTYFLLWAPREGATAWEHHVAGDRADAGPVAACRFEPLPLSAPLADRQDAWLSAADPLWARPAATRP
ncbi:NUDIX domain-containing protein [Streptomyces sp. NPDC007088]|uniref:NUDIX domain-containing protein n=1 Tax=Streptomyces sp. NPDC007088 TaxID=3364773 RepID=UPI00368BB103